MIKTAKRSLSKLSDTERQKENDLPLSPHLSCPSIWGNNVRSSLPAPPRYRGTWDLAPLCLVGGADPSTTEPGGAGDTAALPEAGLCSQAWPQRAGATFTHPGRPGAPPSHPPGCGLSTTQPAFLPHLSTCVRTRRALSRNTCALCFFQAGEKHFHPLCALCVGCGRMFAEGEEMYLQGKKERACCSGPEGTKQAAPGPTPCAGCALACQRAFPLVRERHAPAGMGVQGPAGSPHGAPARVGRVTACPVLHRPST